MQVPRLSPLITSASVVLGAIAAAGLLLSMSPMARAGIQADYCPASGTCTPPPPTPTPLGANIVLDTAAGGPNTRITVTGSAFLPNESLQLYWDTPSHGAANVTSDTGGSFTTVVTPFHGDATGGHRLCASVQPNPCANFTLQGAPTPTPPASPVPSVSPAATPSPTPSESPSASPVVLTQNSGSGGLSAIARPPLVFLPITVLLALLGALAYFLLIRVDRTPVLPAASVVHRSARPDFGPPPTRPSATMQPPPADVPPPSVPGEPPAEPPTIQPDPPPEATEPPEPPAY